MALFERGVMRRFTLSHLREEDLEKPAPLTWRDRLVTWFPWNRRNKAPSIDPSQEKGDPGSPAFVDPREELYKRIVSDKPPDDVLQVKWAWYLKYLDARIIEVWSEILFEVVKNLAPDYCLADPSQLAKVYELLVVIAEAINTRMDFSLDIIANGLRGTGHIKDDTSVDKVGQLVWIFVGHLTFLYDPEALEPFDDAENPELRLRKLPTLMRARTRARGTILTSFSQETHLAGDQFHQVLGHFGDLLPKPHPLSAIDRPQSLGNIEHLNVAYLCVDGLKKVAKIRIEWVNTLELHLQLDQRKRILRLFRFPTFCQLLYKEKGRGFLHQLYTDYHRSQLRSDEPDHDLTISEYLREIILSYRLLFGIDPRSRAAFLAETPSWQNDGPRHYARDPLLWQLCSQPARSAKMKALLESFDGEETSTLFAVEDFPFLGRRLVELQRFALWQKPNSWKVLWQDQRDVKDWWMVWTAWAVLIIGGGTVVLQIFQLAFQMWSTVMQFQSPSGAAQVPAGGL